MILVCAFASNYKFEEEGMAYVSPLLTTLIKMKKIGNGKKLKICFIRENMPKTGVGVKPCFFL